ncbi:MAG: AAA family ATPase [Myxococcales bacterium]|nr:AAA family ATPase [Myxococcales bacterium]
MILSEFAVTGFKNLRREVRLTELGRVNVIHGDNSVGKSNLLEAIQLFFSLLGQGVGSRLPLRPGNEIAISDVALYQMSEHRIADIFDVRGPVEATIALEGRFSVEPEELRKVGIEPLLPTDQVIVVATLRRSIGQAALTYLIERFEFSDGSDAARATAGDDKLRFFQKFALFLARNALAHDAAGRPAFALVEEKRTIRGHGEAPPPTPLAPSLLLNLWDASVSTDVHEASRWRLLQELVSRHLPPFNEGQLLVTYDRHGEEAIVMFDQEGARLRHHLLGSGVQQVLGLLGLLLTTHARIVAIEEPECNLRYSLQLSLRDALESLTRSSAGPHQLFLTSHSPAFETGQFFYGLRLEDGVPVVERRPASQARDYTGQSGSVAVPAAGARGEVSWVSSDGLVVVPERLRRTLRVQTGGEVAFLTNKTTGRVELLSEADLLSMLGDDKADGERPA